MIYFQVKSINFDFRNLVYKVKWCKVAESVEIFKKKAISYNKGRLITLTL